MSGRPSQHVNDSASDAIGEFAQVFHKTLIDRLWHFPNRQQRDITGYESTQFFRLSPYRQFHLLKPTGDLRVKPHHIESLVSAGRDDRHSKLVCEIFDRVECRSLCTGCA